MTVNRAIALISLSSALLAAPAGQSAGMPPLIAAIRSGDREQVRELLGKRENIHLRDDHGNTALHWAALAELPREVARLLAAGSDARATNHAGATPLHYGAGSARIVSALLQAGADPNARSRAGNTPMHSAAARTDSFAQIKLLLEAGAEAHPRRNPQGPFEARETPLSLAAFAGDERTVRLLLDHGASPGRAAELAEPGAPASPVAGAVFGGHEPIVKLLVARGGAVNFEDGFAGHSLNIAFYAGHSGIAKFLLEQQNIDLRQKSGMSEAVPPIVWSAYNETGDATFARALLARGLDINEESSAGSTVLSWASKRGETELVAFLRAQKAKEPPAPSNRKTIPSNPVPQDPGARARIIRQGAQRAVALLQRSSDTFLENGFVKKSSCVSCHHQTLPAATFALAEQRGLEIDQPSVARQLRAQQSSWARTRDQSYEMHAPQPAPAAVLGYGLYGLSALRYEPDELTAAMTYYLAETQLPNGSWPDYDFRPPMESGVIVGTALALKALQAYPPAAATEPVQNRVRLARRFLQRAQPVNHSQQVFRYHGLSWAGATPAELRRDTAELLALQRPDGGWAPLRTLESDAWATGHALVALHEAGGLLISDPAWQRGLDFLLRTQFEDGSWLVKSRTWPFQPHFDSQFPHGKDQWISAGATAWAAMALLLAIEAPPSRPPTVTAQERIKSALAKAPDVHSGETRPLVPVDESVDFDKEIRPILERSCVACHGGEKPKAGYSLASREAALKGGQSGEAAIVPGQLEKSVVLRFVQDKVEDLEMPPLNRREKFPALTAAETKKLQNWILQGAHWPEGSNLQQR